MKKKRNVKDNYHVICDWLVKLGRKEYIQWDTSQETQRKILRGTCEFHLQDLYGTLSEYA